VGRSQARTKGKGKSHQRLDCVPLEKRTFWTERANATQGRNLKTEKKIDDANEQSGKGKDPFLNQAEPRRRREKVGKEPRKGKGVSSQPQRQAVKERGEFNGYKSKCCNRSRKRRGKDHGDDGKQWGETSKTLLIKKKKGRYINIER